MQTIFDLNMRIGAQNSWVGPKESLQLRALEKWVNLHKNCQACADRYVPAIGRGFKRPGSDTVWSADRQVDKELLPLLNQRCFRCHSSFAYHVFEKKFVYDRRSSLQGRIGSGSMPPDRILSKEQREQMIKLLGQLTP